MKRQETRGEKRASEQATHAGQTNNKRKRAKHRKPRTASSSIKAQESKQRKQCRHTYHSNHHQAGQAKCREASVAQNRKSIKTSKAQQTEHSKAQHSNKLSAQKRFAWNTNKAAPSGAETSKGPLSLAVIPGTARCRRRYDSRTLQTRETLSSLPHPAI